MDLVLTQFGPPREQVPMREALYIPKPFSVSQGLGLAWLISRASIDVKNNIDHKIYYPRPLLILFGKAKIFPNRIAAAQSV